MGKKVAIELTKNESSLDLFEEASDVSEANQKEKKMDKPLVEHAVYSGDHGTVNPMFVSQPSDEEERPGGYPVESPPERVPPTKPKTIEMVLAQRQVDHPTTNCQTMMHILKGNIGTGILAMPEALKNSGLAFGTVGILLIGIVCVHCMHMLVQSARMLYVRLEVTSLDYMDVAEKSFATGPEKLRKLSKPFRVLTMVFLFVTQMGFCCVYFLFVAQNFEEVFQHLTGTVLDYRVYMTIILPVLILLNFVRNLKLLSYASTVANVLQVASFALIFYSVTQDLPPSSSRKGFATFAQLPLWFGTSVYAFEGISLVLPLENKMKTPLDFGGWTGVLNTGMVIVACLYAAIGFFGYLKYGEEVEASITLNIALNSIIGTVVRLAYAISILLTYMLQMYVPVEIIFPLIKKKLPRHWEQRAEYLFRTGLVLLTFALPAAVSQLGPLISLVGAISGSYLTVILPPILEMVTLAGEDKLNRATVVKDILISAFGLLGFVTGTYASIYAIVTPSN